MVEKHGPKIYQMAKKHGPDLLLRLWVFAGKRKKDFKYFGFDRKSFKGDKPKQQKPGSTEDPPSSK